jgi:hypothetical protein
MDDDTAIRRRLSAILGADRAARAVTQLTNLVPGVSAADLEENFVYCRQEDRTRLARGLRAAGLAR